MSERPAGHGGRKADPQREGFPQKRGAVLFPGGSRRVLAVPSVAGMLLWAGRRGHARQSRGWGFAAAWRGPAVELHPAVVLGGTRGCRAPGRQPQPHKARLRNPLIIAVFLFPAPKRRSGGLEWRAWARRRSRIVVLGCVSSAEPSEQRLLPVGVMEAAKNPGVPGLCTAQLPASCRFLGGRGATGRAHFLAIIEKKKMVPIGAAEWQPNLLLGGFSTLCVHVFGMRSSVLR